jgi:hypothetical protein
MVYKTMKYALGFGLWNLADEFEMDDEKYTFKVLPINYAKVSNTAYDNINEIYAWNPTFVVYNEDGEAVADNKIKVDDVEYTISLEVDDEIKVNATTAAIEELAQITIYASYEVEKTVEPTAEGETATTTTETVKVKLADLLEAEGEYVYTLEGALDEIFANVNAMGALKVSYQAAAATSMSRTKVEKFIDAYNQHIFYTVRDAAWNIMNTYKNKTSNSVAKNTIGLMATEYGVKYKSVAYGAMSIEDIYKGLNRFIGEADAVINGVQ